MKMKPTTRDAYKLIHSGCIALSNIEANGMRVDTDYLSKTINNTREQIEEGKRKLKSSKLWKAWKHHFGDKAQLGSRDQLAHMIFEIEGYPCEARTPIKNRPKADKEAFARVDHPFVREYFRIEKLKKIEGTYLRGIEREIVDGYVHPFFNLHTVRTYRSSSSNPNFQNIPIRDPEMGKVIRKCFIPRDGHQIVEIDYSGIEVRIAACYSKDPAMIENINDPTGDMHRDMAAECFMCGPEDVTKEMRYAGKNGFVFPQFYGSYWAQCAPRLWDMIIDMDLEVGAIPVRGWLEDVGIKRLGDPYNPKPAKETYLRHIKKVEANFWNRYSVYDQWKRHWFAHYQKYGEFEMLTGFRVCGFYKKNKVLNYSIQGVAFHCLLWSLIRLDRWLTKNKMRTVIVGQIHDSIVTDVHVEERDEFLQVAKRIMTEDIREEWVWIIVPLEVEAEVAGVGESWNEKKEVEI